VIHCGNRGRAGESVSASQGDCRFSAPPNDYLVSRPFRRDAEERMRYLCLVYQNEEMVDALPGSEHDAVVGDGLAFDDELRSSGRVVASDFLQPVRTATTVRVRNGRVTLTDGPFAETNEQLGGFYVIEARDLNDAIRVASKLPSARLGCVEVRPIKETSFA
jgi:hypothetical protein